MPTSSSARGSSVGDEGAYEDANQKHLTKKELEELEKHSMHNIKGYMPKDQTRLANELATEETKEEIAEKMKKGSTYPAMMHGNKPSRGAMIDAELEAEDEAMIKKKQAVTDSLPGKKN